MLDGEFTFICDGKKTVLGPGGYIFLPRNIPHGIRCTGSDPSTFLVLATPGTGFRRHDDRSGGAGQGASVAAAGSAGSRKTEDSLREI